MVGILIGKSDSQDDCFVRYSEARDMSHVNHVLHPLDYIPWIINDCIDRAYVVYK